MNNKRNWIAGLVIIILVAVVILFLWHSQNQNNKSSVVTNSTSTNQIPIVASSSVQPSSQTSTQSSPQIPVWGQYDINVPNGLILVDSQGRRTGEDPITGTIYNEIPNASYGIVESTPGHSVGELTFSNLPKGQYTLYVLGGQTGAYGLDIANNKGQQTFQGTIQKGAMIAYAQNYDPTNLASSTFSASSTVSSTASITTAPPNNLPPPPLP